MCTRVKVPSETRGIRSPWSWSYRAVSHLKVVWGIKLSSSGRAVQAGRSFQFHLGGCIDEHNLLLLWD